MSDTNSFVSVEIDPGSSVFGLEPVREVVRYDQFVKNLFKGDTEKVMALHAALGVCGEAGELGDAIKKEYIYGKPRDLVNIVEELGDLEFYLQQVRNHYGIDREYVLQCNAEKLSKRYVGLKYTDAAAIARADKETGAGQA
jgi:NTP pyrophosphatase (non-canonical NTP hydrolase)